MLYRLHQIKGHTENQRGRGREETVKQRGDRDEYKKDRKEQTKGKYKQTKIQTQRQIYKKMRKNKRKAKIFRGRGH
jgi:hypothetical protein